MALTVWGSGVWLVIKKKPECSKVTYSINVATTFKLATVGFSSVHHITSANSPSVDHKRHQ